MTLSHVLAALSLFDALAIGLMLAAWAGICWLIDHPPPGRPSVSREVADLRRAWMAEFARRDNRILDGQIITSLRQGTSFFASTCLLAIGGVLALIGNTAPLQGVAAQIGQAGQPALLFQVRLLPVALFLTQAFLKFVWAHRIFGYCSVAMAAVPATGGEGLAARAGELQVRAALHFNAGLRSMYFALGALGWLFGPLVLAGTTAAVVWLLWAREFWSLPRDILLKRP